MADDFTRVTVDYDTFHILHRAVALLVVVSILRGENAKALYAAPGEILTASSRLRLAMVNVPGVPVTVLGLAPVLRTISRHNHRKLLHLCPVAVVRADQGRAEAVVVVVHRAGVDSDAVVVLVDVR